LLDLSRLARLTRLRDCSIASRIAEKASDQGADDDDSFTFIIHLERAGETEFGRVAANEVLCMMSQLVLKYKIQVSSSDIK
jgi:hypothetical protein